MKKLPSLSVLSFTALRKLLFFWVRTKVVGNQPDEIELDPKKPICYVLERRSLSDLVVLEQECIAAGLPRPHNAIDCDLMHEKRAFFFLIHPEGLWQKKSRIHNYSPRMLRLITTLEQNPELDIQLVPVSIFWGRSPDKENSTLKVLLSDNWRVTGRLKKILILLLHGRNTFVQFNKCISLRQLVNENLDHNHTTRKLGRILRVHFRRVRSAVLGPDLSHRRTLVNALLKTPNVLHAIQEEVETKNIPELKADALAKKYANEIASDISYGVIRFYDILLSWLWNKLYKGVDVDHIQKIKDVAQDSELIYVPSHRSHMDYLLISYVLYHHGLMLPHIAAGINLNMPLVGPLLRRGGAFFMRRTFKDNQLYSTIFNEYLHTMFIKGYSVEYFVEGGRSRTGRLLQPRMGMLSMTLQSFLRDAKRPIVFVPVYIGYDKIFEGRTYLSELRGKEKKKESILDIFRAIRRLKVSLGKVRVSFGDPISLTDFLNQEQSDWRDYSSTNLALTDNEDKKPTWFNQTVNKLALNIMTEINNAASVSSINLVALALLSMPKQSMDERALSHRLKTYKELLKAVPYNDNIIIPEGHPNDWINYVEKKMQLIHREPHALGDLICLQGNNAVLMTYYRNNILHLFAIPSLLACFFQNNRRIAREDIIKTCKALYPYLKAELFLPWDNDGLVKIIDDWLEVFLQMNLLTMEDEKLRRPITTTAEFVMLSVLAQAIVQTLERYYITIALLQSCENGTLKTEELENKCHLMAQRMSILHGFNAPEFFDKSLFKRYIEKLQRSNILNMNDKNRLVYDESLKKMTKQAKLVLSPDVRHSILQVTHLN